jgi:phage shock protein E
MKQQKKSILFFFILGFLISLIYFFVKKRQNKKNLSHISLSKSSIIDVRTPDEYALNHFDTAINIPLDELSDSIHLIKKMKKPIVLYCRTGNRSARALEVLKSAGIRNVYNGINQETLDNSFSW